MSVLLSPINWVWCWSLYWNFSQNEKSSWSLRRCLHSATDYDKSTCKVVLAAHEAKRRLFTLQLSLEKQFVYSILINSTPPRRPSSCNANHFKNRFISVRSSDEYLILIWHVMMFFFTCLRRHYRSEHRGIYFTKKPMTATYLR